MTPQEQATLAQTVLGEAGPNASPEEYAAIAHTVFNRMGYEQYPSTITGIVKQPGAYQAWGNPHAPNYPGNYGPKSKGWQRAYDAVGRAADGDLPDTTNGATHYLQPETVHRWVAQGKQDWPGWAQGEGQRIGQHAFYPEADDSKPRVLKTDNYFEDLEKPQPAQAGGHPSDAIFDAMEQEPLPSETPAARVAAEFAGDPSLPMGTFDSGSGKYGPLPQTASDQKRANWSAYLKAHPAEATMLSLLVPAGVATRGLVAGAPAAAAGAGALKSLLADPAIRTGIAGGITAAGLPELAPLAHGAEGLWHMLVSGLSGQ